MTKYRDMGNDPDGDLVEIDAVSAYPAELIASVKANTGYGKTAMIPYISTDRADLQRMIDHAERVRKELNSIPASSSRVSAAQWQSLTHELYALLALARRIDGRINP